MSFNSIIENKLYVGDYEAAKDLSILETLGVTHIVACGFDSGYFQHLRKFCYFCIDIIDSPSSNLLQFLPRVTKFIKKAIGNDDDDRNGANAVFVHCVHGQSRSCAVCVAYLIQKYISHNQNISAATNSFDLENYYKDVESAKINNQLLHMCYNKVMESRPQMAINPGFVKQLEIFRQMKLVQAKVLAMTSYNENGIVQTEKTNANIFKEERVVPIQSRAHAYFRSFRSKSEFFYSGKITSKFCPLVINNNNNRPTHGISMSGNDGKTNKYDCKEPILYQCQHCQKALFTEMNIILDWTKEQISNLPISDYWRESQGGLDYLNSANYINTLKENKNRTKNSSFQEVILNQRDIYKIEPMKWMEKEVFFNNDCGSLNCPDCLTHLGYWDLLNNLDAPIAFIVLKSKLCTNKR